MRIVCNKQGKARMMIQLQSKALAALLAEEGGHCRHANAIKKAFLEARAAAKSPPLPQTICNDRTTLNSQIQK
jgi:hypothetical protein